MDPDYILLQKKLFRWIPKKIIIGLNETKNACKSSHKPNNLYFNIINRIQQVACRGVCISQQTRDVDPTLVQCWADVVDGGTTLSQHWVSLSCLLGIDSSMYCALKQHVGLHLYYYPFWHSCSLLSLRDFSNRYSWENIHTASLGIRRDGLISAFVTSLTL